MVIKNLKFKYFWILIYGFAFCIFNFAFCDAAVLYFSSETGNYHQGDVFIAEVRLDTQGEIINAAEVNLSFDNDVLEFKDFSKGNSILTLWAEEPEISGNIISFSGGIPGGYWGKDGLLGKVVFQVRETAQNNVQLFFQDNSRVLLNDGKGTEAGLITKGAKFNIIPEKLEIPKDEWQKTLKEDKIPPQPFKIEISQDPAIFEGKYFIIFSTTDKETGIDHYEVKEGRRNWELGISPHVLKNQKLTNDIWVKVIDKTGNEWIEIIKAPRRPAWKDILYLVLVLIKIIIIIGVIWWILKNVKCKTKNAK